jgi:hypothetical protein
MSELVERLCNGSHRVEVALRPERTVEAFKQCLDRGYVHIKFTETRGGTELGVAVDPQLTDLSSADFDNRTGRLTVGGKLTLDYVEVRCLADINLAELSGTGRLEKVVSV